MKRASSSERHGRGRRIVRRFGGAALVFFAVKGLLWLLVPALAAALAAR